MYICNCIIHVSHNFVVAITVNRLYSCFFCFRALSTPAGVDMCALQIFIIIIIIITASHDVCQYYNILWSPIYHSLFSLEFLVFLIAGSFSFLDVNWIILSCTWWQQDLGLGTVPLMNPVVFSRHLPLPLSRWVMMRTTNNKLFSRLKISR